MLYNISRVILFIIFSIISIKEMFFYDGVGLDATIMGFIFMTPVLLCVSFAAASLLSLPIYLVDILIDSTDLPSTPPDNKKKKQYVDYALIARCEAAIEVVDILEMKGVRLSGEVLYKRKHIEDIMRIPRVEGEPCEAEKEYDSLVYYLSNNYRSAVATTTVGYQWLRSLEQ